MAGETTLDAFRPAIAVVTGLSALGLLVAFTGLIPGARDRLARAEG
jgi:hypothetical protein